MAFCVYCTETELCVFADEPNPNGYRTVIPNERAVRENIDRVKFFDSWEKAKRYLGETLSFDNIWDFGLRGLSWIEFGRLYHKQRPD